MDVPLRARTTTRRRISIYWLLGALRRTTTRIKPTSAVNAFGVSVLAAYPPPRYVSIMSRHQGIEEEREFDSDQLPEEFKLSRSKIMYIEDKSEGVEGEARIGRVYFSKSGKTLYYRGQQFQSLKGSGFKANYFEVRSGGHYWISDPRKDKNDRLYGGNRGVEIDKDVYEEYVQYVNT